ICLAARVNRLSKGRLVFRFQLSGALDSLKLSLPFSGAREDGLWQHTCFEAFLRKAGCDQYLEYNFAPSRAWAAYSFQGYRSDMCDLAMKCFPEITVWHDPGLFSIEAEITLPVGWHEAVLEINLAAVIEECGGLKSYWAITHPPGKPDFHDKDCFALQLEATVGS
ncbi:MAG: DOMON-like domain-containing protein, partial [Sphingorhabdus sp.]